ncbi:TPA: CHAP domain-containing protein [Pseudomonas aeruginosa]|uniref:CHAP domain-containing protein n=1 Tax=Pseudomonas aeruginosa TaxID=287 RepID=UPI000B489DCE|nr:CHAP domain-containing protein [Pseudomonas aeruginosa]EKU7417872.1 CHAP domain-containing protein [Pseudomonas aeruginosa]EKV4051752.1 CHAP domain-containing protein [Pseudomonas aeruginosa]MBF2891812.1 CHAP domain-containing protein [Pseudomonas aeruginosa]MBF2923782.1 CHAP domain-containing protein [Pseudomonas aeruginosa]MBF2938709.1 CHAP domain-containing protein [Pseudomonas aeruginosa]
MALTSSRPPALIQILELVLQDLQEDSDSTPLPADLIGSSEPSLNEEPLPGEDAKGSDIGALGTRAPTAEESAIGKLVLDGTPTACTPFEVASYFWAVGQGHFGEDRKPYASAWPSRWNPVIVEFFKATQTKPEGDTTSWCAAFVNYCITRGASGRTLPTDSSPPTKSARALSFKTWSKPAVAPQPGDIVVFDNITDGDGGKGHVAFFLADQGDRVLVLGGNQRDGTPPRSTICRKSYTKNGTILKVVSYRTNPQLHP